MADSIDLEVKVSCAEGIEATATEETTVTSAPVLEIKMVADRTTAEICDFITYSITYGNTGNARATKVVLRADIPEDADFVTGSATCCASLEGGRPIWRIDHLDPEASEEKKFKVQVKGVVPTGTTQLINRASIVSDELTDPVISDPVTVLVTMPYLRIIKSADRAEAELGDVVTYTIDVKNISSADTAQEVRIIDVLPRGLSYVDGSTLVNGSPAPNPEVTNANTYQWCLTPTEAQSVTTLSYQAKISLAAKFGTNANQATVTAISGFDIQIEAGPVRAVIDIVRGVFSELGRIIGKVFYDKNGNGMQDGDEPGLSDVTLILEDGTMVVTDSEGKYIIPNVEPGDHLLSIDKTTLPESYFVTGKVSKFLYVPTAGTARVNFGAQE